MDRQMGEKKKKRREWRKSAQRPKGERMADWKMAEKAAPAPSSKKEEQ